MTTMMMILRKSSLSYQGPCKNLACNPQTRPGILLMPHPQVLPGPAALAQHQSMNFSVFHFLVTKGAEKRLGKDPTYSIQTVCYGTYHLMI
uniref:Uncharacterized protein n=1 Tax=Rhizophora mucronata TaxID=61149 RepID=A0A2P2P070_RHIMU